MYLNPGPLLVKIVSYGIRVVAPGPVGLVRNPPAAEDGPGYAGAAKVLKTG